MCKRRRLPERARSGLSRGMIAASGPSIAPRHKVTPRCSSYCSRGGRVASASAAARGPTAAWRRWRAQRSGAAWMRCMCWSKAGADVTSADEAGFTPLMYACYLTDPCDYPAVVDFLLDHGADVDAQNRSGETALLLAVRSGPYGVVKALLQREIG